MSATTASPFKSPSHTHHHSRSRSSKSVTTPRAYHTPAVVGQALTPRLSPSSRSPHISKDITTPSPSYFGFVVGNDSNPPDSNPGHHARQNWEYHSSHAASSVPVPRYTSMETNPEYAAFRRQSEKFAGFNLSSGNVAGVSRPSHSRQSSQTVHHHRVSIDTPMSPRADRGRNDATPKEREASNKQNRDGESQSFFDVKRQNFSPSEFANVVEHQQARLSLQSNALETPPLHPVSTIQRSETVPVLSGKGVPTMITPRQCADLLESLPDEVLLLDLRVYPQYASSRIRGALNLCIPTTLLKRPSFTVQKLADTFTFDHDQECFSRWRKCQYIIAYDGSSSMLKEAITPTNVLKKFTTEGWKGDGLIIRGGYAAAAKSIPQLLDSKPPAADMTSLKPTLSIASHSKEAIAVAGGCYVPPSSNAANPFFGNIRQNMDLIGGVGQIQIKMPASMTSRLEDCLPTWLRRATKASNEGKLVSDKFLAIEKAEQKTMQEALSSKVSYGTPRSEAPKSVQLAGIERGAKNRYNNILPYDHSRVRLQSVSGGDCDYVNASHVKSSYSNRSYIATQAPVPATMSDFWKVVWEQDTRVIVMLTAEQEGGQIKSHPYWHTGTYGPMKLKNISEKRVALNLGSSTSSSKHNPLSATSSSASLSRPAMPPRRSTTQSTSTSSGSNPFETAHSTQSASSETPSITVRHFTLQHTSHPFLPLREITQLHYSQWPDFGAPADPTVILALIDLTNQYVRANGNTPTSATRVTSSDVAPEGERPILVHCSAGCGRTGTFCTVDSVVDMLKQQRSEWKRARAHGGRGGGGRSSSREQQADRMDVEIKDDWIHREDIDLIAKCVEDFRRQRPSMVQNLRQFVLCYESVLKWLVREGGDDFR